LLFLYRSDLLRKALHRRGKVSLFPVHLANKGLRLKDFEADAIRLPLRNDVVLIKRKLEGDGCLRDVSDVPVVKVGLTVVIKELDVSRDQLKSEVLLASVSAVPLSDVDQVCQVKRPGKLEDEASAHRNLLWVARGRLLLQKLLLLCCELVFCGPSFKLTLRDVLTDFDVGHKVNRHWRPKMVVCECEEDRESGVCCVLGWINVEAEQVQFIDFHVV
jgi:hypothetical protein